MGRIRALRECFGEFCQSTTIQGFQSFGDPNKHWLFRLAWLFITMSSFTTAGIFIYGSFQGLLAAKLINYFLILPRQGGNTVVLMVFIFLYHVSSVFIH